MAWTYGLPAALLLLAPFNILASLGMDIYLPVVPEMPRIFDTTTDLIQFTLTAYMIMLGFGQVAFGPISDHIGRRPVLIGGALIFVAASFLLAATASAPFFVALRMLQAVGASATLVAIFATIRDVYADKPESTSIYGWMNAMLAFVPALGPIAGALIADMAGWRGIFVALGIAALAALLWSVPRWHETRTAVATHRKTSYGDIVGSPAFWTYTLAFAAAMGTFFVFFSTAPRVLIDGAGYSRLEFSFAFATTAVAMILAARFSQHFVAEWGTAGSVARGMAMLLAGATLLLLGEVWLQPSFWSFMIPMWLISIGIVLTATVTANGALEGFGDIAGAAVALHFCMQSIIVGIAGTAFVVMLDGTTAWPLAGYAATMAVATLVALLGLRRARRSRA
jgi:DHA1 family florfenicol/chloramphenicol resistance protein-like MFS transporter